MLATVTSLHAAATLEAPPHSKPAREWPDGAQVLQAEDLDGLLLVAARLHGITGRDTAGALVLDTGAGCLALDRHVAFALGLSDTLVSADEFELTPHPLARLELGALQFDQVTPVLTVDAEVVRRVTDRAVLGLLGQRPLAPYLVWIDYGAGTVALLPDAPARTGESPVITSRRLLPALGPRARAVPFRLLGDGKLLVRARIEGVRRGAGAAELTLVLDTGASKTVLFEPALAERIPRSAAWPALRGLSAPTLFGSEDARVVRVPHLVLAALSGTVRADGVDAAAMSSELTDVLSRVVGEPVHGLLGYSFLRRFRIAIDLPRRLVWFEPLGVGRDARPYEYSHVGVQVERVEGALRIVAVATPSPASEAGLARGDEIESIDGATARGIDVITLLRRLEGPPGSRITLVVRHRGESRTVTMMRRQLL